MKKYCMPCLLFLVTVAGNAQFTKLFDFSNRFVGQQPFGGVIYSAGNNFLYGMTNAGGGSGAGNVFAFNLSVPSLDTIYSFVQVSTNGANPYGNLTLSGGKLYGMTSGYGLHNDGNIFSMNLDGTGYKDLYDFTDTIGAAPNGALIISGNMMYGTTTLHGGGMNGYGSVFSIHTDGTGVKQLVAFTGSNGRLPCQNLVLAGNVLYGMTTYGGANGNGRIFSVHTDGTSFTSVYDFNNSNIQPLGSLSISGNNLYGCIGQAGLNNLGFVFTIHTNGTGFRDIFDFNGTSGSNPVGAPVISGQNLYGTTTSGGLNTYGTIFSMDTSGQTFHVLYSFSHADGTDARAQLTINGTMLYGTAATGGINGNGTIFSYKVQPLTIPICMVSVDDSSKHNMVIWQKQTGMAIDSFIIFRETSSNLYQKIGARPYSALSEFVDTVQSKYFPFTGDPNSGTYRYKLQIRDSSGNYSLMSPYHNTLFVTKNAGTFTWNQYVIEGDTIPLPAITAYVLYRDDNSTGSWHQVTAVSGSQTTVTDPAYASFPNGSWRVETTWGITCTPTARTFSSSLSNIMGRGYINGIESLSSFVSFGINPNPVNDEIMVSVSSVSGTKIVKIYNLLGEIIFSSSFQDTQSSLYVSNLKSGIYTIEVSNGARASRLKFVKY